MVCSAEQSRLNGANSKGAITERGKAISSRNATKHGLLATQPPILVTEDLETFQGIVQGLIDQYDPQSPIEHLLIQKVAMGWQRLHRVWNVEAAIANLEMLKDERANKAPNPDVLAFLSDRTKDDPITLLKLERKALKRLVNGLEDKLWGIPKRGFRKWCESEDAAKRLERLRNLIEQVIKDYPKEALPPSGEIERGLHQDHIFIRLVRWKVSCKDTSSPSGVFQYTLPECQQVCADRMKEIDSLLDELQRLSEATQTALIASKAIPQSVERLSRYERHIWKMMQESLERLNSVQHQRKTEESMGSFG